MQTTGGLRSALGTMMFVVITERQFRWFFGWKEIEYLYRWQAVERTLVWTSGILGSALCLLFTYCFSQSCHTAFLDSAVSPGKRTRLSPRSSHCSYSIVHLEQLELCSICQLYMLCSGMNWTLNFRQNVWVWMLILGARGSWNWILCTFMEWASALFD